METTPAEGANLSGTPPPAEASPTSGQEENQTTEQESEVLPFHKHPRWEQLNKEFRTTKTRAQQLEQQLQNHKDLIEFGDFLKANPNKAKRILEVLQENEEAAKGDPFAEYEPDVAERLKTVDELKQWKAEQERQREEQQNQSIQEYQAQLDTEFDQRLVKDGFLGEDGTPKNGKVVDVLSMAMKSFIDTNARDPKRPSRAEFDAGYQTIMEVYKAIREEASRDALKNAVTDTPPPTGSGRGAAPGGKTARTEQDRIADLVSSI